MVARPEVAGRLTPPPSCRHPQRRRLLQGVVSVSQTLESTQARLRPYVVAMLFTWQRGLGHQSLFGTTVSADISSCAVARRYRRPMTSGRVEAS